jgi:hypothetical protein
MAEPDKKDRGTWSPRTESNPLFINGADYERGLGEAGKPPDIDVTDEGLEQADDELAPASSTPFKPGR